MPRQLWLANALGRQFAPSEIRDPWSGWATRGSEDFAPVGVMAHHTGVARDNSRVLADGRGEPTPLAGPLCNVELGTAYVRVIAAGRANHAGTGDPIRGIAGSTTSLGIEATGDGKTWTPWQRQAYPRLATALLSGLLRSGVDVPTDVERIPLVGHKEFAWRRGKWDPGNWDMDEMRADASLLLRPPPPLPAVMRRGSRGAAVRAVQQRLADRGWRIAVDGDFGPWTDAVVRAYQREKGLAVDGVVGPITWRSMWTAPR